MPEGLGCLAGQRTAGRIRDRAGDHDREGHAACFEGVFDGEDGRFCIQRVEDRLDHEQVHAAIHQRKGFLEIGVSQGVEVDCAVAGIVDVRGQAGRTIRRPEHAGDEARFVRGACCHLIGAGASQTRRLEIELRA